MHCASILGEFNRDTSISEGGENDDTQFYFWTSGRVGQNLQSRMETSAGKLSERSQECRVLLHAVVVNQMVHATMLEFGTRLKQFDATTLRWRIDTPSRFGAFTGNNVLFSCAATIKRD